MTAADEHDLWVFGYGSLMWKPGFQFIEARRARIVGFSRRFCVASVHHRGSARRPGLVLGLDRGGVCEGIVYRVPADRAESTLDYLREREQVNGVYRERRVPVEIEGGASVRAVAYLVERAHPSYVGRLPIALQARIISGGRGLSGVNLDYVIATLRHLAEIGIRERELERLGVALGGLMSRGARAGEVSPRAEVACRAAARTPLRTACVKHMRPSERRRFGYRRKLSA
ncbi:MAG: gamma-glutamylcyclotransferase [Hyphomicrobiaceae bacterium]